MFQSKSIYLILLCILSIYTSNLDAKPKLCNTDTDGDGICDALDLCPLISSQDQSDLDRDRIGNLCDDDDDNDGLTDIFEIQNSLTDPLDDDSDDDYLTDGQEVNESHTNPLSKDTDQDFLPDPQEFQLTNTDPLDADSDDDGLNDARELYRIHTQPRNPDTDGDHLLDGAEVDLWFTNPLDVDSDDDSLNDDLEVLTYHTDPNDTDTDDDDLTDDFEILVLHTDPLDADSDDDDLYDGEEHLIYLTNPLDFDTDDDGLGDGYEIKVSLTDPLDADSDDDGLNDGYEINESLTDPNDTDSDDDLLTDFQEVKVFFTDPNDIDTDDDQLRDDHEVLVVQTSPIDEDTDDDGLRDDWEISANQIYDQSNLLIGDTNPLNWDTDGDTLADGLELAVTQPLMGGVKYKGTDLTLGHFTADQDPSTKSNPNQADTDADGVPDQFEDLNLNGAWEPALSEINLIDADSDDDGLNDFSEVRLNFVYDFGTSIQDDTNPLNWDTDGDTLPDGLERAVTQAIASGIDYFGTDLTIDHFIADLDPSTQTNPNDPDTDQDQITDQLEDLNRNGKHDRNETDPNDGDTDDDTITDGAEKSLSFTDPLDQDSDDDGLRDDWEIGTEWVYQQSQVFEGDTDPNNWDTDGDLLPDGLERSVTAPIPEQLSYSGTDIQKGHYLSDLDPSTNTNPNDADSDDDGLIESKEDVNFNGAQDATETNPNDSDSDDDGLSDFAEVGQDFIYLTNGDFDGDTNPLVPDTDADGLPDGLEKGITQPLLSGLRFVGTDLSVGFFIADQDPSTRTNPNLPDTDFDGLFEKHEDRNRNGQVDTDETNPNDSDTDDDGLKDGDEVAVTLIYDYNEDFFGQTNPLSWDTDGDTLPDGLERATAMIHPDGDHFVGTDLQAGHLILDQDTTTRTNPNHLDSDSDGVPDQYEDLDRNGRHDQSEIDPLDMDSDDDGLSDLDEIHQDFSYTASQERLGDTDPLNWDTDGDLLPDGLERAVTQPIMPFHALVSATNINTTHFLVDFDPSTTTNPNKADTDDDFRTDSQEDANLNGKVDLGETDPNDADTDDEGIIDGLEYTLSMTNPLDSDSDDDGLTDAKEIANLTQFVYDQGSDFWSDTDPNNWDTDGDSLPDGLEKTNAMVHPDGIFFKGTDLNQNHFIADLDVNTFTNANRTDTDGDGVPDQFEDLNRNGRIDQDEINPSDADSDDDGLNDLSEIQQDFIYTVSSEIIGDTNPLNWDTDGDLLPDGLERAVTQPIFPNDPLTSATDTSIGHFLIDFDPSTTTNPNKADTDDDFRTDSQEDANLNGKIDLGETDPNDADTDDEGIMDGIELTVSFTNPLDSDSDDDGLSDLKEITNQEQFIYEPGNQFWSDTDPNNWDTDGDSLPDGLEKAIGFIHPDGQYHKGTDLSKGHFIADLDPNTFTNANNADTDGDGVPDQFEDLNRNGSVDPSEINPFDADSDDDGLNDLSEIHQDYQYISTSASDGDTNPLNWDTDGDLLPDGLERSITQAVFPNDPITLGTDIALTYFIADQDPSTSTNPNLSDTDGDLLSDSQEDSNRNGKVDSGETDPNLEDSDDDLIADGPELTLSQTNPLDQDSDDDGLSDFTEVGQDFIYQANTDFYGETNPNDWDTDHDLLPDGLERSVVLAISGSTQYAGTDLNQNHFIADQDPSSQSNPNLADSDQEGLLDSMEDFNLNGQQDPLETNVIDKDSDDDGLSDFDEIYRDQNLTYIQSQSYLGDTDPLKWDTDGDGLSDGLELSSTGPIVANFPILGTDLTVVSFQFDMDPSTQTNPNQADTDQDLLIDSQEDININGKQDQLEMNPLDADSDDDGLSDQQEVQYGLNPIVYEFSLQMFGDTDPLKWDTDGDGAPDGLERSVVMPISGGDLFTGTAITLGFFIADDDPSTKTNPNDKDTDDDGLSDVAEEIIVLNGKVDEGETDPNLYDTDQDRLSDGDEVLTYHTNPLDKDTEDEGLLDGEEILDFFTDPNLIDTDGDGLTDFEEIKIYFTKALDQDSDDDTLSDYDEVKTYGSNPNTQDTDADDLKDQDEVLLHFTKVNDPDSDDDLILDGREVFIATHPLDQDTDDDGLSDFAEIGENLIYDPSHLISGDTNPLNADTDSDLLPDGLERGLTQALADMPALGYVGTNLNLGFFMVDQDPISRTNPNQSDTDGDLLSDSTEDQNKNGLVDIGETDPLDTDSDDDDLSDGTEVLSTNTNPLDADSDDDRLTDGREISQTHTNPLDADSDDDDLIDGDEVIDHHTNPLDPDTDDDTLSDGYEVNISHTDPLSDADADQDGLKDQYEIHVSLTNQHDSDSDDDGLNDGVEVNQSLSNPNDPDSDDDTLSDYAEFEEYHSDPNDRDTDNDMLEDPIEVLLTTHLSDADTDDDGLSDYREVGDDLLFLSGTSDLDDTNPLDADTDGDFLVDGLERGLVVADYPHDTDLSIGNFVIDLDPSVVTNPNDPDTDADGIYDAFEDINRNGRHDEHESHPLLENTDADGWMDIDEDRNANGLRDHDETHPNLSDSDSDGIEDHIEDQNLNFFVDVGESNPLDADSDDDGLTDGDEIGADGIFDPTETNPFACDSDLDLLPDGLERGVGSPIPTMLLADTMVRLGTNLTVGCFKADLDPTTFSNPLSPDSDGDTLLDSQEDLNHNGKLDAPETLETDPNLSDTDGDGVDDVADESPRNKFKCRDTEVFYAMGQLLSEEPLKKGDGCDDCALGQVDAANDGLDTDTDSICDQTDNCIYNINPNQIDVDHDAIGDACDFCNNNGQPDPNEQCDDGNMFNCDSCTNECKTGPNLMFKTFKDFDNNPSTANSFKMGSTVTTATRPVRNIALPDFQMAHREVTVADYKICQNANPFLNNGNICSQTAPTIAGNTQCNYDQPTRQNHPINCITFEEAQKFINWCTASLTIHPSRKANFPTEAQWEFVAKNSPMSYNDPLSDLIYTNNNVIPACTNTNFKSGAGNGCGTNMTAPVCTKGAINAVDLANQAYKAQTTDGMCDLSGNVSEWILDSYALYDNSNLDGSAFIGTATQALTKVIRGGSYLTANSTVLLRTYGRSSSLATNRSVEIGMRIACPITTVDGLTIGCSTRCGDQIISDQETCDDGNLVDGDGCSMYCQIE